MGNRQPPGIGLCALYRRRAGVCVINVGHLLGTVVHELIELCLVLGVAQTLEEGFEVVLFFFQTAQGFGLVGVECAVAGAM